MRPRRPCGRGDLAKPCHGQHGVGRVCDGGLMRLAFWLPAILVALLSQPASATRLGAYAYPFVNPLAATVAATPTVYRADLPPLTSLDYSVRHIRIRTERPVPDVYWFFGNGLEYTLVKQPHPAPLVFVVAGTGASAQSIKSQIVVRALAKAGMNVVSLPNPTHPNFIVTASRSGVPGRMPEDARDLMEVMSRILADLRPEITVTEVDVAGYSLGATEAAFVGKLDDETHALGFTHILLMNPPVSLYAAARNLDGMFDRHVSTDPEGVRRFIDYLYQQFVILYSRQAEVDFTDDFLYRAYSTLEPNDVELETLIGFVFRLSALDLAFASDVLNGGGYIIPKNAYITPTTSLTGTLISGIGLSFTDYIKEVYTPFFMRRDPGLTRGKLVEQASLHSIEGWLRTSRKIDLITNEDDIVLDPGDALWLNGVFGRRAILFPTGGHCGNMDQRDYVAHMTSFLGR